MNEKIKPKILIIEDDKFLRDLLVAKFKEAGLEASGLADANNNIVQKVFVIQPDLVLSNVMLPGLDGFEIIKRLKADARTKDIPFVFLTCLSQKEDIKKGLSLGAVDYLVKSRHTPTAIVDYIKSYLENPITYKKAYLHAIERSLEKHKEYRPESMKEKIKRIYPILIVILIVLGLAFYWYEWRPSQIRRYCSNVAKSSFPVVGGLSSEEVYQTCLRDKGLEK